MRGAGGDLGGILATPGPGAGCDGRTAAAGSFVYVVCSFGFNSGPCGKHVDTVTISENGFTQNALLHWDVSVHEWIDSDLGLRPCSKHGAPFPHGGGPVGRTALV